MAFLTSCCEYAAFTEATCASPVTALEEQQAPEGDRVRGQDTAELFHFFKQAQAHSASVSDEVLHPYILVAM